MFTKLKRHWEAKSSRSIISLFDDPNRAVEFSIDLGDLFFDYSKTQIDKECRAELLQLAKVKAVEQFRSAMFSGEKINKTEDRSVLHVALRNKSGSKIFSDGENVMPKISATLAKMRAFTKSIRDGEFKGLGGNITDVVNIGIGGSDLGPFMATSALAAFHTGPKCHFVSNVDGAQIHDILECLDPKTTLIIVASKTFTTTETMTNARTALDWMTREVVNPTNQFVAVSNSLINTSAFGIPEERVFDFAEWVGGRYSVWGPIGLSLMIAIGEKNFDEFLEGAFEMDQHFQEAPMEKNMPIMLALVGIWHNQICGYHTRAVLPYEQRLSKLPAYLQQLEMESNGKNVSVDGKKLTYDSGPIVWGEPGTNGQHAFFQLIHQGTRIIPCEFMVGAACDESYLTDHHDILVANCLAQSEALMLGMSMAEVIERLKLCQEKRTDIESIAAHRLFPGNRPSTTLVYSKLSPSILGKIIALYEHRVFVEGIILGINSFDQWGVELGKVLAEELTEIITGEKSKLSKDGSTQMLLSRIEAYKNL